MKGKNYLYPNAIVDFNLKIVDSNSYFNDFFKNQKVWNNLSIKITDLIEFDNLNEFKKYLHSVDSIKNTNASFNGKIKTNDKDELIKITIHHIQDESKEWSNQAVELTCQKIENLSSYTKFPKLILEDSPLKIFSVDRNFQLTFFSKSAISLLEHLLEKKPIIGQSFLVNGMQIEEWKNYFDIIYSGESIFLEKNYQKRNKEFYDLLTLSPLKNNKGDIVGCIVYANDILQLKKIELLHYHNQKKYQHLFEDNFLGIGVLDENSILTHANDSFCRLAGIKNNDLEKIRAYDFIFGDDLHLFTLKIKEIYRNEISTFTSEVRYKNTDNELKYAQISLNGLYKNNKFSGCLFCVLDISDQKEIQLKEQELKVLKSKEQINLNHQLLLQQELDSRIRELTSNQMLIAQKNNLIKELKNKLERIIRKSDFNIRPEIRKVISSINRSNVFDDDWENLKIHFVKMHPSFFETLTNQSSKITDKDLRHCAYIKLGFSAKETSDLLGTLPRSIEQARFRIKKKLDLPSHQKLKDYLRNI